MSVPAIGGRAQVGLAGVRLAWDEGWAETPSPEQAVEGWAHHGLALLADGRLVAFHPSRPDVVVYDREGRCVASFPTVLVEGHGITAVMESVEDHLEELLWIADPGNKMRRDARGEFAPHFAAAGGQVAQYDLAGGLRLLLDRPRHPAYDSGFYAPTAVAVDEARLGGNGDVFVADGYGQSLVHRFAADGRYLGSLDGTEGPSGRLDCPHGIAIDRRRAAPELLVADRGNALVRVYRLDGTWVRDVGRGFLNSPSAFAFWGERTIVGELRARLAVLGPDEELLGYLGENSEICRSPGWPNSLDDRGVARRQEALVPGRFNSPHGLVSDGSGAVYVAEWLVGGRMVRLEPLAGA